MSRHRFSLEVALVSASIAAFAQLVGCSSDAATDPPSDAGSVDTDAAGPLADGSSSPMPDASSPATDAGLDARTSLDAARPRDGALVDVSVPDALRAETSLPDSSTSDASLAPDVGAPSCSSAEAAQRAQTALSQPLVPLASVGGVDLHDGAMHATTLLAVETALCAGADLGSPHGSATRAMGWGPTNDLTFDYLPSTKGSYFTITAAYAGAMTFHSPDGVHGYAIALQQPPTKDGQPFLLEWSSAGFGDAVDELYRALLATYAPNVPPPSPNARCTATGHCNISHVGAMGVLGFQDLAIEITIDDTTLTQPAASRPSRIDAYVGSP